MAIAYRAASALRAGSIYFPSGIQDGDVVFAASSGGTLTADSTGASWTLIPGAGAGTATLRIYWRRWSGSASTGSEYVTLQNGATIGQIVAFSGVIDSGAPYNAYVSGTTLSGSVTTSNMTSWDTSGAFMFAAVTYDGSAVNRNISFSGPTGGTAVQLGSATNPTGQSRYVNTAYYDGTGGSGNATASASWATSADGVIFLLNLAEPASVPTGSVTGSYDFSSGGLTGSKPTKGSVTGAFDYTGATLGARESLGALSGAFDYSGSGTASAPRSGDAVGGYSFAGAATGKEPTEGSAAGGYDFAGSTSGVLDPVANTTGAFDVAGSASGVAAGAAPKTGAVTGTWTFAPTVVYTTYSSNELYDTGDQAGFNTLGQVIADVVGSELATRVSIFAGGNGAFRLDVWADPAKAVGTLKATKSFPALGANTWVSVDLPTPTARCYVEMTFTGASGVGVWWTDADVAFGGAYNNGATVNSRRTYRMSYVSDTGARGVQPREGSSTGSFAYSGSASGKQSSQGSTAGAYAISVAETTGRTLNQGEITGVFDFAATATGATPVLAVPTGTATGSVAWTATAGGLVDRGGAVTAVCNWTGYAYSNTVHWGVGSPGAWDYTLASAVGIDPAKRRDLAITGVLVEDRLSVRLAGDRLDCGAQIEDRIRARLLRNQLAGSLVADRLTTKMENRKR